MATDLGVLDEPDLPNHPDGLSGDQRKKPVSLFGWFGRILAAVIVAGSFGVWVYVYSGYADRPPPDLLTDPSLAVAAESICAAAVADVEAMPSAGEAADGPDRAVQVRRATDRFEQMLDELDELEPTDPVDRQLLTGWLADWRTLLSDRRTYADAVAQEPDATFLLTVVAENERLDRRMTRVANTNAMPSCAAPTDV